jgi:hypothetical protein
MKTQQIILLVILLLLSSCIAQFIPEVDEDRELLVVEGLITNKAGINTIKLSKSLPLGRKNLAKPLKGCQVRITDDIGRNYTLKETLPGTYVTDPAMFKGIIGVSYTLHINTNTAFNNLNFESIPMLMKPVPAIDSLYYEKLTLKEGDGISHPQEGCQIYLNTSDPQNNCRFYRWEYSETWEFRLPYTVPNKICYITNNSGIINVKNTSVLAEDKINRYPLNYITNSTDRLKVKYSILVNQYSLNEDEFIYWEKLQTISEDIGGLYDVTPSAIPSNIVCINNPAEKVLGYFSVSSVESKRLFIKEYFWGQINLYTNCATDTVIGRSALQNNNIFLWVIEDHTDEDPPWKVFSDKKGCADCTTRGTTTKPPFWDEVK